MPSIFEQQYDLYSAFQYPWMTINTLLLLWFLGHVINFGFETFSEQYRNMEDVKRRNCVTYVLEIIVTAYSFIALCYGATEVFFQWKDLNELDDPNRINWLVSSLILVALLYVYELIYRSNFGWPLLVHHLVTLIYIQLNTATLFDTSDVRYVRFSVVLAFTATLERTSFIALLFHRFEMNKSAKSCFYIAFIQSAIVKTLAFVVCIAYFAYNGGFKGGDSPYGAWDKFWTWSYVPLIFALFLSQLYALKIMYNLAKRHIQKDDTTGTTTGRENIGETQKSEETIQPTTTTNREQVLESNERGDNDDIEAQLSS